MAPHIEYCRSCMTENLVGGTNLADSYNAFSGEKIDLATMFHKTTNINPLEDDFSRNLCEFCTDFLRIAFEFRSQCWVSQNILVNIYRAGHGAGKHQLQMRPMVKIERLDTETADDDVPMLGYLFESRLKKDEENILEHHDNTSGLASNDIRSLSDLNQTVNNELSAMEEDITLVPSDSEIFVCTVTCVTENETHPNESSYAEPIKASKKLTNEKTNAENSTKNAALGYYPCHAIGCTRTFFNQSERRKHRNEMQAKNDESHKTVSLQTYQKHIQIEQSDNLPSPGGEKVVDGYNAVMSHKAKDDKIEAVIRNASKDFYAKDTLTQGIFCPAYGCTMLFSSNKILREHLEDVKGSPNHTYRCDICNTNVLRYRSIYNHITTQHVSVSCEECKELLPSKESLLLHKRNKHNKDTGTRECPVCKRVFRQLNNWKRHVNNKVCTKPPPLQYKGYMCPAPSCRKTFRNEKAYRTHMKYLRSKPCHLYQCDLCQMEFDTKPQIQLHLAQHVKLEFFKKCELCDKVFISRVGLRLHMRSVHFTNMDDLKYPCKTCGQGFPSKMLRFRHWTQTHQTKKPISVLKCDLCGKEYLYKSFMETHMQRAHLRERKYPCKICGKMQINKDYAKKHEQKHSTERVACLFCGKLMRPDLLTYHEKTHEEVESECNVCHRKFTNTASFKHHMKTHQEKKLQCQFCELRVLNAFRLQKHIDEVHYKIKKFSCTYEGCNEMFIRKRECQRHIERDHLGKESRYKQRLNSDNALRCPYENCDKSFVWKSYLNKHIHVAHLGYTNASYREKFGYKRLDRSNQKIYKKKVSK